LDERLDNGTRTALWSSIPALVSGGAFVAALAPAPFAGALRDDPLSIALLIVLLIVCLGVHEAAHAWVAWKCGDSTARDLGRLTLNPIAHVDLFMTIILPAILIYTTGFIFGGAKPVPVDFHRLRHPWRDMSLVAFAGPLSNFLLAILFAIVWKFLI
jgi:Zn-dependent protease